MAIPFEIWVVLKDKKYPVYCASYEAACHEHINDVINDFDLEEPKRWTVHMATVSPGQTHNVKLRGCPTTKGEK